MNIQAARVIFDQKMQMIKEQTGRDPKLSLLMSCGPDDAEIIYNRMFACFYSGLTYGMMLTVDNDE